MRTPCAAQLPRPVCGRTRPADHEVAALVAPLEGNPLSTAQYPLPGLYLPTAAPYSEYCTHSEYYLPPASQRKSFFHTCRRARVCSGTCAYVPTCAITHARGLSACVRACVRACADSTCCACTLVGEVPCRAQADQEAGVLRPASPTLLSGSEPMPGALLPCPTLS